MIPKKKEFNSVADRLIRAATFCHREAQKCLRGKAYLAAVVMQVAVFESSLQVICMIDANEVKLTHVYQAKKFRRKRSRALELNLNQLIRKPAHRSGAEAKNQ